MTIPMNIELAIEIWLVGWLVSDSILLKHRYLNWNRCTPWYRLKSDIRHCENGINREYTN